MSIINYLVEGDIDEAVAVKIIQTAGHTSGVCYGKRGHGYIRAKIQGFNRSVQQVPCLALVDFMDTGLDCAVEVLTRWLPHRHANMFFRIVIREIESWLLADSVNLARFLGINKDRVPTNPEQINDPKLTLVNLARHSKIGKVRTALVPEQGSTAQVGKLYTSEVNKFVRESWNVEAARLNSPSLDMCVRRLEALK